MNKTKYKELSFLFAFTLSSGDWVKVAELDHVKQTYHFGDIGTYTKMYYSKYLGNTVWSDDIITGSLC